MKKQSMRSHLALAAGLGSAREGLAHWWAQRLTAIALVPLTLWFVISLIALTRGDYATFVTWRHSLFNTVLLLGFVIALFYHMALGLQVIVEDYVHNDRIKVTAIVAVHFGCVLLAITCVVSILRAIA